MKRLSALIILAALLICHPAAAFTPTGTCGGCIPVLNPDGTLPGATAVNVPISGVTGLSAALAGTAAQSDLSNLTSTVAGHTTQLLQTPVVYNGSTPLSHPKTIWRTGTTSAGGVLTIYPTSDGTATGTALFPTAILGIEPSLAIDGGAYFFSGATVSADRRTVTMNVTKSSPAGITVLGITTQALTAPVAAASVAISVAITGN